MALIKRSGTLHEWDGSALVPLSVRQYNGTNLNTVLNPVIVEEETGQVFSTWLRGAAGNGVANGQFGNWAGYEVEIAATWNDSKIAQEEQWSFQPGLEYGGWNKPVDVAVGAIYKTTGESWAAAATGAYDARWTKCLQRLALYRGGGTQPPPSGGGTGTGVPLTGTVKIMPVGDSLTAVDNSALGYKGFLLDHLVAAGKSINYVGTKTATGPAGLKDFQHEGIPGAQNSTFLGQYLDTVPLSTKLAAQTPHVMTYMVGVNDLWSNVATATAISRLNQVLDAAYATLPNLRVVVCTVALMGVAANSNRAAYNDGVRAAVTRLKAAGKHCTLADVSNTLGSGHLQGDGIHWTTAAHQAVAAVLRPIVLEVINGGGTTTPTQPTTPTPLKGTTYIRFAHEFSGSFMNNWSVSASEAANFILAWRRFTGLQRSIFPAGKMTWCPNSGASTGLDVRNAWPGNEWVDVVGVDYYNAYPAVNTRAAAIAQFNATETNGAPKGIQKWWEYAQSKGKPFAIPEWATNGNPADEGQGQDAPVWIEYFFEWLTTHDDVEYECFYNDRSFGSGQYGFYPDTMSPLAAARYAALWKTGGVTVNPEEPPPTPPPPPPDTAQHTWTGGNGAPWPAEWTTGLTGTNAVADIQNNMGRLRTGDAAGAYNGANKITRRLAVAPPNDFDAIFRFVNEATECYPSVCYRGDSTLDGAAMYQISLNRNDAQVRISRVTAYAGTQVGNLGNFAKATSGETYWCRVKVAGNLHKVKLWSGASASEPVTGGVDGAGFQVSGTDSTYTSGHFGFSLGAGGVGGTAGQANFYVEDLTFGGSAPVLASWNDATAWSDAEAWT